MSILEHSLTAKDEYYLVYSEAVDLAVTSIRSRFNQKGFITFPKVEQLVFKACGGKCSDEELNEVCNFFYNNFNRDNLAAQLLVLKELYISSFEEEVVPSIANIQTVLSTLTATQRILMVAVCKVFRLLLILPATNATSERSFSALRRIKTYLRNTMTQARLNHLMVLQYHQEKCDKLNLECIANDYIKKNETRRSTFAMY